VTEIEQIGFKIKRELRICLVKWLF